MGLMKALLGHYVYMDANIFIYALEYAAIVRRVERVRRQQSEALCKADALFQRLPPLLSERGLLDGQD